MAAAASSSASTSKRKAGGGVGASAGAQQHKGAAKRTRFTTTDKQSLTGDDDEDVAGDLDIAEQDRKRSQQGRKGRVMTDGYDSDDSEENSDDENGDDESDDDVREGGKAAGIADEDEDMFNLDDQSSSAKARDENESKSKRKTGKSKAKYLELKDIEGQEFSEHDNSANEGNDAELELESDEGENDEREKEHLDDPDTIGQSSYKREKKSVPLESFNMKNEMASGRFDEEGNYIANAKDPHAEHDKWLRGNYSKKGIVAAKEAKAKREREVRLREKERENAHLDEDECKMRLAGLLRRGETVLEALQRLGAQSKKAQAASFGKPGRVAPSSSNGKQRAVGNEGEEAQDKARAFKAQLDQITSLTSELMSRHGFVNIYDESYESIVRDVRKSGLVRSTWDPAAQHDAETVTESKSGGGGGGGSSQQSYWYKWSPAYLESVGQAEQQYGSEQQVFGPFSVLDLLAWKQSGFFGEAGERIVLRAHEGSGVDSDAWGSWTDVLG